MRLNIACKSATIKTYVLIDLNGPTPSLKGGMDVVRVRMWFYMDRFFYKLANVR